MHIHRKLRRKKCERKRSTKVYAEADPILNLRREQQKRLTEAKKKNIWIIVQRFKVLFSDESNVCILFRNQGPRVGGRENRVKNPCCFKSRVKLPQSKLCE